MNTFERYINSAFRPLDIVGTTSYGIIPRAIWRMTWGRKRRIRWFLPYRFRAMHSTHIAVASIGRNGQPWLIEMDGGKFRTRYVSRELGQMVTPDEFSILEHSCKDLFEKVKIFSGVSLTEPQKYMTRRIRAAHVCWIGRMPSLAEKQLSSGNEWLYDKYRHGVPYDYADLIALWNISKSLQVIGSDNIYVCSELPQKCFEHIGVFRKSIIPMTPMDWQINKKIKRVKC